MQEFDCLTQFVGHLSDLLDGVRFVIVVLEEIEDGRSEHFERDADVAVIIEPIQHLDAFVLADGVVFGQLFEDIDLELGRFSVLFHILDDLEGDDLVLVEIFDLDHFSEGAFSERGQDFESVLNEIGWLSQKRLPIVLRRILPSSR